METREGKHPWLQHIHAELYNHLTKLYRHTHRHTHIQTCDLPYTCTNTPRSLPGLVKENVAGLWILLHVWGDPVKLFNLARINFLKSADKQTKSITTSLTQLFCFILTSLLLNVLSSLTYTNTTHLRVIPTDCTGYHALHDTLSTMKLMSGQNKSKCLFHYSWQMLPSKLGED